MERTITKDRDRLHRTKRMIQLLLMLSKRDYTMRQIGDRFSVNEKTVRRDLMAIEELNIPLIVERRYDDTAVSEQSAGAEVNFYRIERHFLRRFL